MSDYKPSDELKAALHALDLAEQELDNRRKAVRAAVANDLKANPRVTNPEMADHLPWTAETVRAIAREYDVPRKRQPTVKAINPKPKQTAGAKSSG
ncbi:hypothetical protein [Streptomyces sp. G1]|uniref:hypothetical protein n=1 Tax=Streptomyces sp. G1 TaxID=361572 RepID=UPI00202E94C5|nr:hypothetical protein [Streptomyces sp. G1]MCM1964872.1 hypothetical protein [Streptomyces sp. G1]